MGIMLAMLFISMLTLAFKIQPVRSEPGTIYIKADGSIDPPTANITTTDNVTYTFTYNNYGSIVIERDNITVDGAGYVLRGTMSETGIALTGRSNVTIKNMKVEEFRNGIVLESANTNILTGNMIYGWEGSIQLSSSSNNIIYGNGITAGLGWEGGPGITISGSNNLIYKNSISGSTGIILGGSNNNVIGNSILGGWGHGIQLGGNHNNITGNYAVSGHGDFRAIHAGGGNNIITGNTFGWSTSCVGIRVCGGSNDISSNILNRVELYPGTSNNRIYHNNIAGVFWDEFEPPPGANSWDDSYPSGGNYWSGYAGVDLYSGPYQNESGSDGIGDTPRLIDPNNRDNYPFMSPYYEFDIAVTDVSPSRTKVSQGQSLPINVTVENQGRSTSSVTFDLTLKATYTYIPQARPFLLLASAAQGWNYSIPGPTMTAIMSDTVQLTLKAVDTLHHLFYVDCNGNAFPDAGEPQSPNFFNETIPFSFTPSSSGNFTYYCAYHQSTMYGPFTVDPQPQWSGQIASQNVTLLHSEEKNVTLIWNTNGFALGNYTISASAIPVLGELDTTDNTCVDGMVAVMYETKPVGGISIPINKLELIAPYIGLTILLAVAVISVGYVKKRKRDFK